MHGFVHVYVPGLFVSFFFAVCFVKHFICSLVRMLEYLELLPEYKKRSHST
jgi:hypothetical protein